MSAKLLAPRYWLTWTALGWLRLCVLLPMPVLRMMGVMLGKLAYRLPGRFTHIARCNIDLCYPDKSTAERERILRDHFISLGHAVFETGLSWWASDARILRLTDVEGTAHLEAALQHGKGVILLSAHFTTLDISGRALTVRKLPFNLMYRPTKNPVMEWFLSRMRGRHARRAIRRDDARSLITALKANEVVWYAPDQSYRNKGAQMVPFFNIPCASNAATSRLAKMTGAQVLPYLHERLPNGHFRMQILPAFEHFPSDDAIADTQRFHAVIEAQARRLPAQYLWIHRRFKGLSPEYPNYYAQQKST